MMKETSMTEQQYRVIADRDKGDDPQEEDIRVGDRYTFESVSDEWVGGDTDILVRIERPVPTTCICGPQSVVSDGPNVDCPVHGEHPSVPTREQIAEVKKREFEKWTDHDSAYERAVASSWFDAGADAVLALLQKGGDRG